MKRVSAESLDSRMRGALIRRGLSEEHAGWVAGGLLEASLRGVDTHGVRLFSTYKPRDCAVEGVFHHRNVRSALILGHARGVCLLAAAAHGVPVSEYAPAVVKRAVTGHGAAEKERVASMVGGLLRFEPQGEFDETDALALALCHLEAARPLRLLE